MSANETEFLPAGEVSENLREVASAMESDSVTLRELSRQLEEGEIEVHEIEETMMNLETDEYI